jgi:hypothetical protein
MAISDSSSTTASTAPEQNVSWNVASWLQSACDSSAFQMTVQLASSDETDSGPFVEFGPNPTLTFTYTQPAPAVPVGTGPVSNATFLSFPFSDKVSLQVNVGPKPAAMAAPGRRAAAPPSARRLVHVAHAR